VRAVAGIFLMLFPLSAIAGNATCTTAEEIVHIDVTELNQVTPCDMITAQYLLGFGHSGFWGDLGEVGEQYAYYIWFRSYLLDSSHHQRDDETTDGDANVKLILGALALGDLPPETDWRFILYRAFSISEAWKNNPKLGDLTKETLNSYLMELMRGGDFRSVKELSCFIQYDVPVVPIHDILSAENYQNCISEG